MSFEAQLQNSVSWAVPRYIEHSNRDRAHEEKLSWTSYVPPNPTQSPVNPASLAMDFLMLLDCRWAVALELKYRTFSNRQPNPIAFNPGQKEVLESMEKAMLVCVCFNMTEDLVHRIVVPDGDVAKVVLEEIAAVSPSLVSGNAEGDETLHSLLERLISLATGGQADAARVLDVPDEEANEFQVRWHLVSQDICEALRTAQPPSNLFIFAAGEGYLSAIPGRHAIAILEFLRGKDYEDLRPHIKVIGKAYLKSVGTSHRYAAKIGRLYHAVYHELVKFMGFLDAEADKTKRRTERMKVAEAFEKAARSVEKLNKRAAELMNSEAALAYLRKESGADLNQTPGNNGPK